MKNSGKMKLITPTLLNFATLQRNKILLQNMSICSCYWDENNTACENVMDFDIQWK